MFYVRYRQGAEHIKFHIERHFKLRSTLRKRVKMFWPKEYTMVKCSEMQVFVFYTICMILNERTLYTFPPCFPWRKKDTAGTLTLKHIQTTGETTRLFSYGEKKKSYKSRIFSKNPFSTSTCRTLQQREPLTIHQKKKNPTLKKTFFLECICTTVIISCTITKKVRSRTVKGSTIVPVCRH